MFYNKQRVCPNCDFEFGVTNNYCPECGQKNTEIKIGIGTLIMDLLGDVFTYDSKIFKSLWYLVSKPGKLTKDFNDGKRARFVPPLRMFLVMGVVVFSVISIGGDPGEEFANGLGESGNLENVADDEEGGELKQPQGESTRFTSNWISQEALDKMQDLASDDSLSVEAIVDSLHLESFSEKIFMTQATKIVRGGPGEMVRWIFNNFTLVIFFMVPFFAFIMKLLYFRKGFFFMDHLIFSLHQHSLVYMGFLPVILLDYSALLPFILFLVLPIYTLFAMRRVYGESWRRTVFKQVLSSVVYVLVSLFVLSFFILMGFLLF